MFNHPKAPQTQFYYSSKTTINRPRAVRKLVEREKTETLLTFRCLLQEQKPEAGPGDANSEYIKLKVVGNVSKPSNSLAFY